MLLASACTLQAPTSNSRDAATGSAPGPNNAATSGASRFQNFTYRHQWSKVISKGKRLIGPAIQVHGNGDTVVTGWDFVKSSGVDNMSRDTQEFWGRYDADGNVLWEFWGDSIEGHIGVPIAAQPDGGTVFYSALGDDHRLGKRDEHGKIVWERSGAAGLFPRRSSLGPLGKTAQGGQVALAQFDDHGQKIWSHEYFALPITSKSEDCSFYEHIWPLETGDLLVAGRSIFGNCRRRNSVQNRVWRFTKDGTMKGSFPVGPTFAVGRGATGWSYQTSDIASDPQGRIYLAGGRLRVEPNIVSQAFLFAFTPQGEQLWRWFFMEGREDEVNKENLGFAGQIHRGPDGRIVLVTQYKGVRILRFNPDGQVFSRLHFDEQVRHSGGLLSSIFEDGSLILLGDAPESDRPLSVPDATILYKFEFGVAPQPTPPKR